MPATASRQKPGDQVVLANEEFLAMLAHELRNPLAPIMNAIHVIERHCSGGNQLVKNATEILGRQVGHIVGVINDLLDVAKIAKGEMPLQKRRVEMCALVKRSVEECRSVLSSRRHLVEVKLPDKDVWVNGDEGRLNQVLSHLLTNAAKFTETGGKISVTANYGDGKVMVNVRDSGIGIPAEAMSEIFNLFSQPDHTRHMAQGGGLGIGLTLAKQLTKMHGGTIEAYSGGIGKGSEFSVIIPLEEVTDKSEMGSAPVEKTEDTPSRCLEILVVDDHIDTAESLAILLKMWGHVVRVCHSGTAAIQMAKVYQPDVALLDIGLPGCDGYQVAEKLKEECKDILLIAITGYGQKVDRRRSGNAGFHTHLVKPVVADKLKEAIAIKSEASS